MKNPYEILGVSKSASQEEIKNAYRSLAKKNHPDLNPGNKSREAKFKEISAAYELIGDEKSRAKFDRGETDEAAPSGFGRDRPFYYETQGDNARYSQSFGHGLDDDFFENLFSGSKHGGARKARSNEQSHFPGEDHLYQMEVDFRDAVLGAEREIALPTGKKLQIKIPAGVESGTRLRFRGQGAPGFGKGVPGDAYVEITVRPQQGFSRHGRDLEVEVPVTFLEAALGAEIQVPPIDGPVSLRVPGGVSTGSKLRVRGKGVGSPGGERGDQIVTLKVVMPKKIDPELLNSMAEWQKKFSFNPRVPS